MAGLKFQGQIKESIGELHLRDILFLQRSLQYEVASCLVEISNWVSRRRHTVLFSPHSVKVGFQTVIWPSHLKWVSVLAMETQIVLYSFLHLLSISPILTTIGPVSAGRGVKTSPLAKLEWLSRPGQISSPSSPSRWNKRVRHPTSVWLPALHVPIEFSDAG